MIVYNPRPGKLSGIKYDTDKIRWDLLPFEALNEVAKVMTFGAMKYTDNNWRGGFKYSRVVGAALRHITSWVTGESKDPETGLSHLTHAACCLLFLITFEITKTGEDDRFKYPAPVPEAQTPPSSSGSPMTAPTVR